MKLPQPRDPCTAGYRCCQSSYFPATLHIFPLTSTFHSFFFSFFSLISWPAAVAPPRVRRGSMGRSQLERSVRIPLYSPCVGRVLVLNFHLPLTVVNFISSCVQEKRSLWLHSHRRYSNRPGRKSCVNMLLSVPFFFFLHLSSVSPSCFSLVFPFQNLEESPMPAARKGAAENPGVNISILPEYPLRIEQAHSVFTALKLALRELEGE